MIEQLTELRHKPGGIGLGVWGNGLSTSEIKWQIEMEKKYGAGAKLPPEEVSKREIQRKKEDNSHAEKVSEQFAKAYPPDWKP